MSVRDIERELAMVRMYASGKTLHEVAAHYGISRNRTWLLIQRHAEAAKDGRLDWVAQKHFGCDHLTAVALCGGYRLGDPRSPATLYRAHKRGAAQRGIEWNFTLPTWLSVWMESGHWYERGCALGKYVMARHGDAGPYAPTNVYITRHEQNGRDAIANGRFQPFRKRAA